MLSPDHGGLEWHKAGDRHLTLCSPVAGPKSCHRSQLQPCPDPPIAMLLSGTLLLCWLLQIHPPFTSCTIPMQKAVPKMLLGTGSAAFQGWKSEPLATVTHAREADLFCPEAMHSSPTLCSTSLGAHSAHTPGGMEVAQPSSCPSHGLLRPQASWHSYGRAPPPLGSPSTRLQASIAPSTGPLWGT